MSRPLHDYTACGLRWRSSIPLFFSPHLPSDGRTQGQITNCGRTPDVTLRLGAVPAALPVPAARRRPGRWEVAPGIFLATVDGVARFLATEGRDVLIEPCGGADRMIGGAFCSSLVLPVVLQQRGVMTLHAGAVATETGAVLFLGAGGVGKSSLVATLHDRGHAMLTDDVAGVVLGTGEVPMVLPAFPGIRLWSDTLAALDRDPAAGEQVWSAADKYMMPMTRFHAGPLALRAICVLTSGNWPDIEIKPVPPIHAFKWLSRCTQRVLPMYGSGKQLWNFRTVSTLAASVPFVRVFRPEHVFRLDALADRIEDWIGGLRAAAGNGLPSPVERAGEGSQRPVVRQASCPPSRLLRRCPPGIVGVEVSLRPPKDPLRPTSGRSGFPAGRSLQVERRGAQGDAGRCGRTGTNAQRTCREWKGCGRRCGHRPGPAAGSQAGSGAASRRGGRRRIAGARRTAVGAGVAESGRGQGERLLLLHPHPPHRIPVHPREPDAPAVLRDADRGGVVEAAAAAAAPYGYASPVYPKAMLARLAAGGRIARHTDPETGPSHVFTHKIHVPLQTDPRATLTVGGADFHLEAGHAWEVNNLAPHEAFNGGAYDRVHFIFEVFDGSRAAGGVDVSNRWRSRRLAGDPTTS